MLSHSFQHISSKVFTIFIKGIFPPNIPCEYTLGWWDLWRRRGGCGPRQTWVAATAGKHTASATDQIGQCEPAAPRTSPFSSSFKQFLGNIVSSLLYLSYTLNFIFIFNYMSYFIFKQQTIFFLISLIFNNWRSNKY